MPFEPLTAVSSVDGRYRDATALLAEYFSEYALIKKRVVVECEYLIALSQAKSVGVRAFTDAEKKALRDLCGVSIEDARTVKKIEKDGYEGIPATNHDVNPIDFENAEGNLGIASALFEHFSRKLPISRLQRDLSDSTVERAFGTAFAHSLIAYRSLLKGFGKISVNEGAMLEALQSHPEVIAEGIQTALRREGVAVPYEQLKALTRGKKVTIEDFATFIDGLSVTEDVKKRLKALRPESYIGLAENIARSPKAFVPSA
jgi:adenylosuccinate lyase